MKVTLKYPHTHAGVAYPAGAEVDVDVVEALWLKGEDLIHAEWDALKAEVKKLASRDNPTPYAGEIAAAQAKADATATANADAKPAVTVPAPIAASQETTK